MERYRKVFPMEQMKIFLYEDFVKDPQTILRDIFSFLEVDPTFTPDMSQRYNANPETAPLDSKLRAKLIEIYRNDIKKLESLIGRDLSGWLKV